MYRTVRDRLNNGRCSHSVIRPVLDKPLSVEVVFSCMHVGPPVGGARKSGSHLEAKLMSDDDVWIHEADPAVLGVECTFGTAGVTVAWSMRRLL